MPSSFSSLRASRTFFCRAFKYALARETTGFVCIFFRELSDCGPKSNGGLRVMSTVGRPGVFGVAPIGWLPIGSQFGVQSDAPRQANIERISGETELSEVPGAFRQRKTKEGFRKTRPPFLLRSKAPGQPPPLRLPPRAQRCPPLL